MYLIRMKLKKYIFKNDLIFYGILKHVQLGILVGI